MLNQNQPIATLEITAKNLAAAEIKKRLRLLLQNTHLPLPVLPLLDVALQQLSPDKTVEAAKIVILIASDLIQILEAASEYSSETE